MKKIASFLSIMFLFTALAPAAMAKDAKKEKTELSAEEQLRLEEINSRLAEIKSMDFADMEKAERMEIKNELKEIKKAARDLGGGVYISVGAIIIILLLILLLT